MLKNVKKNKLVQHVENAEHHSFYIMGGCRREHHVEFIFGIVKDFVIFVNNIRVITLETVII